MRTFIIIQGTNVTEVWDVQTAPGQSVEPNFIGYGMLMPDSPEWRKLTAKSTRKRPRRK